MSDRDDLVLSWARYDLGTVDPKILIRWAQQWCEDQPGDEHDAVVVRLAMLSPQTPREAVEDAFAAAVSAIEEPFPDDEETWRTFAGFIARGLLADQLPAREATRALARLAKERDELSNWLHLEACFIASPSGQFELDDVIEEANYEAIALLEMLNAEPG